MELLQQAATSLLDICDFLEFLIGADNVPVILRMYAELGVGLLLFKGYFVLTEKRKRKHRDRDKVIDALNEATQLYDN